MKQYHKFLKHILKKGQTRTDRTGVGTIGTFGYQMRFDLSKGFPLVTTKKVHWKSVVHELLWFLKGDTNIKYLNDNGVHIWDEWRRPYSLNRRLITSEVRHVEGESQYRGDYSTTGCNNSVINIKLASQWVKMMRRCYDPTAHNYRWYGGQGVTVDKRWHECGIFIDEVKTLPHWWYKEHDWNNFSLDKDYYHSSTYSKETTVWLSKEEQCLYTSATKPVFVELTTGSRYTALTIHKLAEISGKSSTSLHRFLTEGVPVIRKQGNRDVSTIGYLDSDLRLELIPEGDLGNVYGAQWRNFNGVSDQIATLMHNLTHDPFSRRHIVSAWNVGELDQMALPPCHCMFQCYVDRDLNLSMQVYQRSADAFLGVPFNIASYALLLRLIALTVGMRAKELIWTGGDCHIYLNHLDQVKEQLSRGCRPLPQIGIIYKPKIDEYEFDDIQLCGYNPHPPIKAPIAI